MLLLRGLYQLLGSRNPAQQTSHIDDNTMRDLPPCDKQVRCFLPQEQRKRPLKPVGYPSTSLDKAETAYDTTHICFVSYVCSALLPIRQRYILYRQCLAVVWAILLQRSYLEKSWFTIRAAHGMLRRMLNMIDTTGKLVRQHL